MKSYLISVVSAGMICAITGALFPPKTAVGQIAKLLSGILLTVTVISPLTNLSFQNLSDYINNLTNDADSYVAEGTFAAQKELASIIKTETEAYILDKANQMGLQIAVEVVLDENNHSIPSSVTVTGNLSPYTKEALSSYIENTLGIAKEKQIWSSKS